MNMPQQQHLSSMMALLRDAQQRPLMYIGTPDSASLLAFLSGVAQVARFLDIRFGDIPEDDIYRRCIENHGWTWSARNPFYEMLDNHMSFDDACKELIDIHIETLEQRYLTEG